MHDTTNDAPWIVDCSACGASMNAMTAPWCPCVTKQPNLVCGKCGHCLCGNGDAAALKFWFSAPLAVRERRAEEVKARTEWAARHVTSGGDVLVVDDDEDIRLIASFMLQQIGYVVSVAEDPDEVLQIVRERPPRVVLTDALMPRMDGRELCRRIKAIDGAVQVVIMTSLYTGTRYRNEAHRVFRADGYVAKPIDFQQLQRLLEELAPLSSHRAVTAVTA